MQWAKLSGGAASIWNRALILAFVFSASVEAAWAPPENPSPEVIHKEANADRDAKRYDDALAKYLWCHEHGLKHQKTFYGVRLSGALADWERLADEYPAARTKMIEVRDETEKKVRTSKNAQELFDDYVALNRTLHQETNTIGLFKWLGSNRVDVSWAVFDLVLPELIKAKEYALAGRYLDPVRSYQKYLNAYKANKKMAGQLESGKELAKFAEKDFVRSVSTLVAVLTLNNRKLEAERVAGLALKDLDDPGFSRQLENAKKGRVPPPNV